MILDEMPAETPPIVAILRGVQAHEIAAVAEALIAAGMRFIEVPLNSPDPLATIRRLTQVAGDRALCGAGTVLTPAMVDAVAEAGGRLIVTPNSDPTVIAHAVRRGLEVMPGFATPTEAFAAVGAGARRLKLFPAQSFGPTHLKAMREVLPHGTGIWAVGGVDTTTLGRWLDAGAQGVAVGSAIYRPGDGAQAVGRRAAELVEAWRCWSRSAAQ
ncbi:MAG TPA: 2-dehydro-3-deoxy-6-phosphogalactonate aldolase [Sphingobium sp.]|nr:2-dehydro-3-deoxy-6-phosphogalactonate aldolase [Sphingobium sp.]